MTVHPSWQLEPIPNPLAPTIKLTNKGEKGKGDLPVQLGHTVVSVSRAKPDWMDLTRSRFRGVIRRDNLYMQYSVLHRHILRMKINFEKNARNLRADVWRASLA